MPVKAPSPRRALWLPEEAEAAPTQHARDATKAPAADLDTVDAPPTPTASDPTDRWQHLRRLGARHLGSIAVLAVVAIVFASVQLLRARTVEVPLEASAGAGTAAASSAPASAVTNPPPPSARATIAVHVVGHVARPGVVRLPEGSRVADALRLAGGTTKQARLGSLNLASVLPDGAQLVIGPHEGQESRVVTSTGSSPTGSSSTGSSTQLDLNNATAEQLEELPGVGPVTARNIVAWREKNGRFTNVAELQEVDGIGPKTYQRLAPHVRV